MRKLILLLPFLAFISCKEISYREPQPRGKKALVKVPDVLIGSYLLVDKENSKDTIVVSSTGYMILSDKKKKYLGDSLVLKSYKGYYFINVNENPEWLVRVITHEDNGDLTFRSMNTSEDSFNDLLKRLSKEVKIDSLNVGNEKLYQIDPSPKQLLRLVKKGYFSEAVRMIKLK